MNRKEDQFFEMFRSSLADYQPETPASVYSGIRKKMVWSNFLSFNATSLNVWYVALIVGAGLATMGYVNFSEESGQLSQQHAALDELNIREVAANTCASEKVEEPVFVIAQPAAAPLKAKPPASASASSTPTTSQASDQQLEDPISSISTSSEAPTAGLKTGAMEVETMKTAAPTELASVEVKEFQPYGFSAISTLAIPDLIDQIEDENRDNIVMKMVVFGDKK